MATNVTEKDKTLQEVIDWAKSRCHEAALSRFDVRRKSDRDFYDGQVNAFHEMLELCRSMLGYSGSMPSEVPNQSEGAKLSMILMCVHGSRIISAMILARRGSSCHRTLLAYGLWNRRHLARCGPKHAG